MSKTRVVLAKSGLMLTRGTAGLEPFAPTSDRPWDARLAGHLLRRTMFGPRPGEIVSAAGMTPARVVDQLLADASPPAPPDAWVTEAPYASPTPEQQQLYQTRMNALRFWWLNLMLTQGVSLRERMVLFWHNHFSTEARDVQVPQLMYQQNQTLRQYALGNVKDLVKAVTRDPAMLIYLDGRLNQVGRPNENYSRELMELFTMGVNNYTQRDVSEAARALTGWIVNGLQAAFVQRRFDAGTKTILGRTGAFNDTNVVDILFDQWQTAMFLCRKLYRTFVYQEPDEAVVAELADTLRENQYEIRPVLRKLLLSAHFFDETTRGSQIRSPIDLVVGTARMLSVTQASPVYLTGYAGLLDQTLLDPPNVAGWPGYRSWVSTTTLPNRQVFVDEVLDGRPRAMYRQTFTFPAADVLGLARSLPAPNDAVALIKDLSETLFGIPIDEAQQKTFLDALLQGAAVYDWTISDARAGDRLKALVRMMMKLPEYQLT
jgi:uncharacterized protein (DUF1800 family)